MKVGITGHQDLGPQETITWLSRALESLINQYNIDLGVTSLAIGADQLYAEILRKRQIRYIAIIPSNDYEKTFTDNSSFAKYTELLQEASDTIKLPFKQPSDTAFFEAGKQVVDLADMMIALWDGKPAKGLGGTGDVVHYACSRQKRVVHINPITHTVSVI
jgi:hypothetical protein